MDKLFASLIEAISKVIVGKEKQIKLALTCLFARGHLLIEDIPGIGKTTLAKTLAEVLALEFRRVQFTNDLLPGDVLGVSIFEQKSGEFSFRKGPIFTQILLADEINRSTPKTQSALLEAMEEIQVSVEGVTYQLVPPFFVIATQNSQEHSGTFPLPDSQLDRFLMRISLGYPERDAEKKVLLSGGGRKTLQGLSSILDVKQVLQIQNAVEEVHVSETLSSYVQDLLDHTRKSGRFYLGLSPRAGLSLLQAARSFAYLSGRNFVEPEDVQEVLPFVAGHRLRLKETRREMQRDELINYFREVHVPL